VPTKKKTSKWEEEFKVEREAQELTALSSAEQKPPLERYRYDPVSGRFSREGLTRNPVTQLHARQRAIGEVIDAERERKPSQETTGEIDLHQTIRGNATGKYSFEIRIPKAARDILGVTEETEFSVRVNPSSEELILRIVRGSKQRTSREQPPKVTVISVQRAK
jgi:hypothetical protein